MYKQAYTTNLFKELRDNDNNKVFIDTELENIDETLNYREDTERQLINIKQSNIGTDGADLLCTDINDKRERIISILRIILTITILYLTYSFIADIFIQSINYIEELYKVI